MAVYRDDLTLCPKCGHKLDARGAPDDEKGFEDEEFKNGVPPFSASLCAYCETFLVFESDEGVNVRYRLMEFTEETAMPDGMRKNLYTARDWVREQKKKYGSFGGKPE